MVADPGRSLSIGRIGADRRSVGVPARRSGRLEVVPVPMAGTPAEYERMALKSIEKAAEDVSDTMYHLTRATIFASLANASASEAGDAGDGRNLPAVRAS
jgi:hypothetical protein